MLTIHTQHFSLKVFKYIGCETTPMLSRATHWASNVLCFETLGGFEELYVSMICVLGKSWQQVENVSDIGGLFASIVFVWSGEAGCWGGEGGGGMEIAFQYLFKSFQCKI